MDTIGYLVFGYMVIGLFLVFRTMYLRVRLVRHIYKQYPEEDRGDWLYMWQWDPLFAAAKTLRAFIKKQNPIDTELARLAKKVDIGYIYISIWFAPVLLGFVVIIICHLLTSVK